MQDETQLYTRMLCGYVERMAAWLRKIPEEQWDWTPAISAPTPRQVAEHTWVTLVGDRQHLEQPDVSLHDLIPDPPRDPTALCDSLQTEAQWWREWLQKQTEETYLAPRKQFGVSPINVRWLVYHTMQQVVYKSGQLSTLYYALGLDGTEPYTAPFPNPFYLRYRQLLEIPLVGAILHEDVAETERLLQQGADPNMAAPDGSLPLCHAIIQRNVPLVRALLAYNAKPHAKDGRGYTAFQVAEWINDPEMLALFSAEGGA